MKKTFIPHPYLFKQNNYFKPPSPRGRGDLFWKLVFGICFGFWILSFGFYSFAEAKEYDGLWFLGYNLKNKTLQSKIVRQAINSAIDRKSIAQGIMGDGVIPNGVIAPGMLGYDENVILANAKAKTKIKQNFVLLHTDGEKTIKIANKIIQDLKTAGIKVSSKKVNYQEEGLWEKELASGKYDLFLMGYKATDLYSSGEVEAVDAISLIKPLFYSKGSANFTFFSNSRVDSLFSQLDATDSSLTSLREEKIREIDKIVRSELPVIPLFYITKL